jgi:hypothetical protein
MTTLEKRKSRLQIITSDVVRERGKLREVVLEAHPYFATVRLKGMRSSFEVSWAGIYNMAVRLEVEKKRAEKKAAKKYRGTQ